MLIQLLRVYGLILILIEIGIYYLIRDEIYQTLFAQVIMYTLFIYLIICVSIPSSQSVNYPNMSTDLDIESIKQKINEITESKKHMILYGAGYFGLIIIFIFGLFQHLTTTEIVCIILGSHLVFGLTGAGLQQVLEYKTVMKVKLFFLYFCQFVSFLTIIALFFIILYLLLKPAPNINLFL